MATKQTKFASMISNGSATLAKRATAIETQARIEQQAIVDNLKKEKTRIELEIMELLDFSPESTDSLRPGQKGWSAADWADQIQTLKMEKYETEIALRLAEETFDELFSSVEDGE